MDLEVQKGSIGSGQYCKVQKCLGKYDTGEVVPYAVKVYNKQHLNVETQSADPNCL